MGYYGYPQYSMGYPQYGQQYSMPHVAQQNPDDKIYVQGIEAAKAYLVTANGFVRLWDSQSNTFYEKRADANGRPSLMAYEYRPLDMTSQKAAQGSLPDGIEERLNTLEKRLIAIEEEVKHGQSDANVECVHAVSK